MNFLCRYDYGIKFLCGVLLFIPSVQVKDRIPILDSNMPISTSSSVLENAGQHIQILDAVQDSYGGVTVKIDKPMDSKVFASVLRTSLSYWRQQVIGLIILNQYKENLSFFFFFTACDSNILQGKRGVWIKLPIQLANLVEPTVKVSKHNLSY